MSKITVLILVEEKNKDISKCLYSLLNQNFSDYTAFVLSNNEIVNKVIDPKIKYIELDNKKNNIPSLLKIGAEFLNTELVTFIHPDDLLLFYALKSRYNEFVLNPEVNVVYGLGIETDLNYSVKSERDVCFLKKNSIDAVIQGEIMPTISSLMMKTDILKSVFFNCDLKICYTWDFFIKIFSLYSDKIVQIADPIYISKNSDELVKKGKSRYFRGVINETQSIIDSYFEKKVFGQDQIIKVDIYKKFYYIYLSLLADNFPDNIVLKMFLLVSYLKTNTRFNNELFEYWYFSALLNSIIRSKYIKSVQISNI